MSENAVGFIFCRGGSKGVPRKNLRSVAGKPLLGHAVEVALDSKSLQRVIVSTDDHEIAEAAISYGAEVPFLRPVELAQDHSPELDAWQHALKFLENEHHNPQIDVFVSVPTTSPLRLSIDIDRCVDTLIQSQADIVLTIKKTTRNPYFNMIERNSQGKWELCKRTSGEVNQRQSAPEVFEITTVAYAARPAYIMSTDSLLDGKIEGCIIPEERTLDIDSEYDLLIAELLMQKRIEDRL